MNLFRQNILLYPPSHQMPLYMPYLKLQNHKCGITVYMCTIFIWYSSYILYKNNPHFYCEFSTPWKNRRYQLLMQMDKFTPEYSLKNIPFPGKHEFIQPLTDKIEDFIKRLRLKAYFYLNSSDSQKEQRPSVRRLKSLRAPTSNGKLDQLEDDQSV